MLAEEYVRAFYASNPASYLSFESIMEANETGEPEPNNPIYVNMASYSCRTPEQIVLERERWMNLREETKQVIDLIVNCPTEVFREITGRGKEQMTAKAIERYLRRQWGERSIVRIVMREIRQYVREVEDDKVHRRGIL